VNDTPVSFDRVLPVFTVMTEQKVFAMVQGVYTDHFESDYRHNVTTQDRISIGLESPRGATSQGIVFVTVNPWTTQTALQLPYTSRFASVPVFCIGQMYEEGECIKLGLGMQAHHGFVDGYHYGHLVHNLLSQLKDPSLLEGPFVSTFE
jgi:chloramphenicol O-acetyltransferase type A